MAERDVRAFINAITKDPRAQEILKDIPQPEDQEAEIKVYADISAQLGYDITEEDLKAYLEKTSEIIVGRTEEATADIQELPDDVLDKVAGGKKDHDNCKDTFKDRENCWINDGCDNFYNNYDNYVCHRLYYSDPCHETAKPCSKDMYCNLSYWGN